MIIDCNFKEKSDLKKANNTAERSLNRAARESIEAIITRNRHENNKLHGCPDCTAARCSENCPRYLTHYASQAEFWNWWGKTSPPNRREREAILHLPAPPAGKSSKSKKKRKKPQLNFKNKFMEV